MTILKDLGQALVKVIEDNPELRQRLVIACWLYLKENQIVILTDERGLHFISIDGCLMARDLTNDQMADWVLEKMASELT